MAMEAGGRCSGDSAQAGKRSARSGGTPGVDLGACSGCGGCIELAPAVFRFNPATGLLEVRELDYYEPESVDEAIKNCPEDCIYWEAD